MRVPGPHVETRVTPRGTHGHLDLAMPTVAYEHDAKRFFDLLPRWRRGELRHAEQRRTRAARANHLDTGVGYDVEEDSFEGLARPVRAGYEREQRPVSCNHVVNGPPSRLDE